MLSSAFASSDLQSRLVLPSLTQQQTVASRQKTCAPECEQVTAMKSVADSVELESLSHARASLSAQVMSSAGESSFNVDASLTYARLATNAMSPTVIASVPASEEGDEAAPQASFSFYEHVLYNATSSYVSVRSGKEPLPTSVMMAAPTAGQSMVFDAADPAPAQRVVRFSADDYAESFTKTRIRGSEQMTETGLSLKLSTREGDTVELDFRQVEVLSRMRLKGIAESGDRVRAHQSNSALERAVQMNVTGDLSVSEMAAIDSLIDEVIAVANKFFSGDVAAAWDRLTSMEFESDELAEFSLRLSVAHSKQVSRAYHGDDGLSAFASRDKQSLDVLEFLAGQQRSLIESAQNHFDDASAVSLVRELLPRMLPDAPAPPRAG